MGPKATLIICFFAFASSVPIDDEQIVPSLGKVAAKLQSKGLHFPDIKARSDEEWVDLIKSVRHSGFLSKYQDGDPGIVIANQTGNYSDTTGFKADWKANSSIAYYLESDQIKRTTFDVYGVKVNEVESYVVLKSDTLYTPSNGKIPGLDAAGVKVGAWVDVKNDESYNIMGLEYELMEGTLMEMNGTVICDSNSMTLYNFTDRFSVAEVQLQTEIKNDSSSARMTGEFISNSIPLSKSFKLSSSSLEANTLIRIFRDSGDSSIRVVPVTQGKFIGGFTTGGATGTYFLYSNTTVLPNPEGISMNSTSSLEGGYRVANATGFKYSIPFYHSMLDHATVMPFISMSA